MIERPEPDEVIEYGQVTLRRCREDDVDAVFLAVIESLDHLRPWMPWAANYTRQTAAGYLARSVRDWADGNEYNYAILTDGVLAGSCSLMARIGPGGLEIGYWVHRACTRRGLATAASAALVEQAFRLPGVDRVEIIHDELNVASGRVPRKLGFTEVGRQPLSEPTPGGNGVGVVWRLTRLQSGSVGRHGIRAGGSDRPGDDGAGSRPGPGQPGGRRRAGRGRAGRGQCQPRVAADRGRAQRAGAAG